jgi:hypothetical protein
MPRSINANAPSTPRARDVRDRLPPALPMGGHYRKQREGSTRIGREHSDRRRHSSHRSSIVEQAGIVYRF